VPDKLGRPPTGALLSQLIMNAEEPDWARAKGRAGLLEKPQWIEADRKRRAVEKAEVERKRKSSENMGWAESAWEDDED
jgi:hypothetical protein